MSKLKVKSRFKRLQRKLFMQILGHPTQLDRSSEHVKFLEIVLYFHPVNDIIQ